MVEHAYHVAVADGAIARVLSCLLYTSLAPARVQHGRGLVQDEDGGLHGQHAGDGLSLIHISLIAFLVSIVLIIIYIAIRFEYKMGVTAIVALLHDLVLVMGVYALVGREVNPNTIAALLTILGYSLYDLSLIHILRRAGSPSAAPTRPAQVSQAAGS